MPQKSCLVNLVHLNPPRNGGTQRIVKAVCQLLADYDDLGAIKVIFLVGWQFASEFPQWLENDRVNVIPCLPEMAITPIIKKIKPDLIVSPLFGIEPLTPEDFIDVPHLAVMPDTLALDKPELFSVSQRKIRDNIYQNLRHASVVVTHSQHAKTRLIHHLQLPAEKIKIVPGAIDYLTKVIPVEIITKPFFFYPANDWAHKRHELLIQVMQQVWQKNPEFNLVLTGYHSPNFINNLIEKYACPQNKIIDLGYVSDEELTWLYREAEALVFVSEYEGFGLPLIEAMKQGCPVVCSTSTAIPEVAGEAALYVNSNSPRDWAEALLEKLPHRRLELIERGFKQSSQFDRQKFKQEWLELLTQEGFNLTVFEPNSTLELNLSLTSITPELNLWASRYRLQQQELESKEAVIQQQQQQLLEKEQKIQQLKIYENFFLTSLYFNRIRPFLVKIPLPQRIKLLMQGVFRLYRNHHQNLSLAQYAPIQLKIPADYYQPSLRTESTLPLVSIVTPSYNQAQFIERTIESILQQKYPNLEYIIQDGNSTDGTRAILERYRDKVDDIESKDDRGQAHAIDLGFSRTRGEIMAWLNSDDILLPGTIDYIVNYFLQHPEVDVVYGHRILIDENDGEIGRWVLPPHDSKVLAWGDYVPQETLFWRRQIWEKVGGYIDESFQFAMDWELLLRFKKVEAKIVRLPRFLGAFRVYQAQKTSNQINDLGEREMTRLRQQCHQRQVSNREIKNHIRPYWWRSAFYNFCYRLGIFKF